MLLFVNFACRLDGPLFLFKFWGASCFHCCCRSGVWFTCDTSPFLKGKKHSNKCLTALYSFRYLFAFCVVFTTEAIAAICSGVVRQQPPISLAPCCTHVTAYSSTEISGTVPSCDHWPVAASHVSPVKKNAISRNCRTSLLLSSFFPSPSPPPSLLLSLASSSFSLTFVRVHNDRCFERGRYGGQQRLNEFRSSAVDTNGNDL